jgi:uncharacterized protein YfaS (alpha-2-macroglobulin family)
MLDIPSDSRDYTHLRRSNWNPSTSRVDMTQTVKYLSGMEVAEDGTSEVDFELSDQITTFKVTVTAYSKLGLYGLSEFRFSSNKPLALAFNLPPNLVQGDSLIVPITLKSSLPHPLNVTLFLNSTDP